METLKIQYEIDFEEMIIKFFVRFTGFEKGYGVKLKYKGLYDNNALEKSLGNFVKKKGELLPPLFPYCCAYKRLSCDSLAIKPVRLLRRIRRQRLL